MDQYISKSAITGQPSDQQKVPPRTSKSGGGDREKERGLVRALAKHSSSSSLFKKQFGDSESRRNAAKASSGSARRTKELHAEQISPTASVASTLKDAAPASKPTSTSFFHLHSHDNLKKNGADETTTNNDSHIHLPRHHQSLANILPGSSNPRASIAAFSANLDRSSPSPSPPIPHPSNQHNNNYGPHEVTMMNRSASTPYQQHQHQQHHIPHHANNDPSPPASSVNSAVSASTAASAMKSSRKKIFSFTKKATRLAGDLAFGKSDDNEAPDFLGYYHPNGYQSNTHYHFGSSSSASSTQFHPQVQRQKFQKQQLSVEYHAKMKNVMSLARNHSMSFYIDYLRFFLKYMDDSELDDPFLYSVTRNTFWNTWYYKYLKSIQETLDSRSTLVGLPQAKEEPKPSSSTLLGVSYKDDSSSEVNLKSRSASLSSAASSQSSSSSVEDIKTKLAEIPTIDEIDSEIFQDRRMVLLLLWHNQIINRLSNHSSIIHKLLASHAQGSEMCIITTNRLKPYQSAPGNSFSKLMKNHISPAHLELIDGWQLRHDFPDYKTNLINISDRFQVLLDLKNSGYLPEDLQQQYPHFNDYVFLSDDFLNSKLKSKERKFLSDYSSFTAPSIHKLPLRDGSQSLIYTPDFTRLIFNENDVTMGLTEFNRVLTPGGSILLILYDVLSFQISYNVNTEHEVRLGEYIQIFINNEISKLSKLPNLSQMIIKLLKLNNFKKIKYVKLGIPVINYIEQQNENEDENANTPPEESSGSADPDSSIPHPTAGEEKEERMQTPETEITIDHDHSEESAKTLEPPNSNFRNGTHPFVNSRAQRSGIPGSPTAPNAATFPADSSSPSQHQSRQNRHNRHTHQTKSSSRTRSPYGGNGAHAYGEDSNDDSYSFTYNRKENLGDVSDQPIASLYCMLSSYIDFLRMSQIVDLHSWISDPQHGHVRNSGSFSGVAGLTDLTVQTLKLWLDWKLNGFEGSLVREVICERIKSGFIDKEGHDAELGVRVKIHDIGDPEKRSNPILYFDDVSHDVFNDGILAGLDSIMLITAEKGKA